MTWVDLLLSGVCVLSLACGAEPHEQEVDDATGWMDEDPPAGSPELGETCEDYWSDYGAGSARELRIHNGTDSPIFAGTAAGCGLARVQVFNEDATAAAHVASCPCAVVMGESTPCSVCTSCLPTALRIDPGVTYVETWDGTLASTASLPDACQPDPRCSVSCAVRWPASGGVHRASILVTSAPEACQEDPELCECDASTEGWCTLDFVELWDETVELAVDFDHPGQGPVELVVE